MRIKGGIGDVDEDPLSCKVGIWLRTPKSGWLSVSGCTSQFPLQSMEVQSVQLIKSRDQLAKCRCSWHLQVSHIIQSFWTSLVCIILQVSNDQNMIVDMQGRSHLKSQVSIYKLTPPQGFRICHRTFTSCMDFQLLAVLGPGVTGLPSLICREDVSFQVSEPSDKGNHYVWLRSLFLLQSSLEP